MKLDNNVPIGFVSEHEVDFTIVQLLETSDSFKQWLTNQADPDLEVDEYIGAITHATYAGEGESDIEFGVLTERDDQHIVLIENKIDATKQPNQIERYYNRGQFSVERGEWDSFTVCLLAPENYVSQEDEAKFDSIIHYEDVLDKISDLTHDGAEFFQDVFELALTKSKTSTTADASGSLNAIRERFQNETELTCLESDSEYADYNKRRSFKSTHPQHHGAIRYDIFIAETGDEGRTVIRLQIKSIEGLTEEEQESLKSIVSQNSEALPNYDPHFHRKVSILCNQIGHEVVIQNDEYDTYIDAIVDELLHLTSTVHPIFVQESTN
jgi:hypothetical protein